MRASVLISPRAVLPSAETWRLSGAYCRMTVQRAELLESLSHSLKQIFMCNSKLMSS